MSLLRAVATIGGYTMISRVLGFVRDILIAAFLGAGPVADAFVVAFRIPNLFRRLVAEGAFSAAFVPMFARTLEGEGRAPALAFASMALSFLLGVLGAFTILVELVMPWALLVLAPGFAGDAEKFELAVAFTRITFPYLVAMAVVALLGGVLNAIYRFAAMSAAPILLNVILIAALLLFADGSVTSGYALAWGVFAAGFAQVVFLAVACRRNGVPVRLGLPRLTPGIGKLLRLMAPGAIGAGVTQINIVVGTVIASFLETGAIAYLYYADRVYQLPLGVIGIAVGTALLPLLARQLRAGDDAGAQASLNRAVELSMLFTLPAAAALLILPELIVEALFQRGRFTAEASAATAGALMAFAAGLPAFVMTKILAPAYFAREDTTTPVIYAAFAMLLNIALSIALLPFLGHVGIALATSVAGWLNAGLLTYGLRRSPFFAVDARLRDRLPRIALATAVMAVGLFALQYLVAPNFAGGGAERILLLVFAVAGGLVLYGGAVQLLGAATLGELGRMLRREREPARDA